MVIFAKNAKFSSAGAFARFADFDLLKTKLELFNNLMEVEIESQASCFQLELCELQADPFLLSKKNERYDDVFFETCKQRAVSLLKRLCIEDVFYVW